MVWELILFYFETRDRKFSPDSRWLAHIPPCCRLRIAELHSGRNQRRHGRTRRRPRWVERPLCFFYSCFYLLNIYSDPLPTARFPAQSSRSWAGPTGLNRVRKCLKFSRVTCGQELHVSFVKTRSLAASSVPLQTGFTGRLLAHILCLFCIESIGFTFRVCVCDFAVKGCDQVIRLSAGFMEVWLSVDQ